MRFIAIFFVGALPLFYCKTDTNPEIKEEKQDSSGKKMTKVKRLRFNELVMFDHFVLLEETDGAFIQEITSAFFINHYFIVFDVLGQKVFQYRENGSFVGVVGNPGSGPGEFQRIHDVFPIGEKLFCILTSEKIMAFDLGRKFLWSLQSIDVNSFMPISASWFPPDMLVLIDVPAIKQKSPRHKAYKFSINDEKPAFAYGFGLRHEFEYQEPFKKALTNAVSFVDGRLWEGSPYESHLVIYNADGSILKNLLKLHPDGVDLEFSEKIYRKKKSGPSGFYQKRSNYRIDMVGDLVIASLIGGIPSQIFDFYDQHGNILYPRVTGRNPPRILSSYGKFIVGEVMVAVEFPDFEKSVSPKELSSLKQAGLDRTKNQNFLWIGRLVDDLPTPMLRNKKSSIARP